MSGSDDKANGLGLPPALKDNRLVGGGVSDCQSGLVQVRRVVADDASRDAVAVREPVARPSRRYRIDDRRKLVAIQGALDHDALAADKERCLSGRQSEALKRAGALVNFTRGIIHPPAGW